MAVYQVSFVHVLVYLTQKVLMWLPSHTRQSLFYKSEKLNVMKITYLQKHWHSKKKPMKKKTESWEKKGVTTIDGGWRVLTRLQRKTVPLSRRIIYNNCKTHLKSSKNHLIWWKMGDFFFPEQNNLAEFPSTTFARQITKW